ncbi:MAG: hypothetical protein PUC00_06480 [Clostridiales bacterium]|nr:hypothetical protein [Clostridiales bacterium]
MQGWIIFGAVLMLMALFLLRRSLMLRQQQEAVFMERMRSSEMYVRLYPVLLKCRDCCVERILVRPEEIRIILYKPMNREYHFSFEAHGLDPVDRPAALRALAQAIALDVPMLADPKKYYFSTHTSPRDGGGSYHWYEYAVQIPYKDVMLRAWYDRAEPEEGIIR